MPTIMTHAVMPLMAAAALGRDRISLPVATTGMVFAMLPDADVIGFKFGIEYADAWGHRGATHSLVFAAMLATFATAIFRPARWMLVWLFLFASAASHGLLDTLTNGGLGAALLWPVTEARYFAPVQPIRVSPIGAGFFSDRGVATMISELRWVILPALILGTGGLAFRKLIGRKEEPVA